MRTIVVGCVLLAIGSGIMAEESLPVTAVAEVDLDRYCGTWYEIARLPNKFQKKCIGNTTAEYSRLPDGKIKVINRCVTADGSLTEAEGLARKEKSDGSNAKLKVRFAPSWLGWIPFVWGTYWIIDLAPDYSYAVVGEPSRKYLWILSRTPQMEAGVYGSIVDRVGEMGFDTNKLIVANQDQNTH